MWYCERLLLVSIDDFIATTCAAFSAQLKAKVGNTLVKAAALWVNLNIDGVPITSRTSTGFAKGNRNLSNMKLVPYHFKNEHRIRLGSVHPEYLY